MTEATHTPGPWQIGYSQKSGEAEALAVWPPDMAEGETGAAICLVAPIGNITLKDEANAWLISAAPDMLEALAAALPYLEGLQEENIYDPSVGLFYDYDLAAALERAKDAIDKALGN
jgi:hypothetical protein